MNLDGTARRRWVGGICLVMAVGMLIAGETLLHGRFGLAGFLAYWMLCFGFTIAAIIVAFMDLRALRTKAVSEQRTLLEKTIGNLKEQARDEQGDEESGNVA